MSWNLLGCSCWVVTVGSWWNWNIVVVGILSLEIFGIGYVVFRFWYFNSLIIYCIMLFFFICLWLCFFIYFFFLVFYIINECNCVYKVFFFFLLGINLLNFSRGFNNNIILFLFFAYYFVSGLLYLYKFLNNNMIKKGKMVGNLVINCLGFDTIYNIFFCNHFK